MTVVAIMGFVVLYEATIHDSRAARWATVHDPTVVPMAGSRLRFSATAYCKGTTTKSGVKVRSGIVAADPALLPVGSVILVASDLSQYNGVYTVMDTGPKVKGRILDIYIWSCFEALDFGRRDVQVTVVRMGWDPRASTPGVVDGLFRQRESDRANTGTVVPSLERESSDTTPTPQAIDDPEPAAPDNAPAGPSELPVVDVDPAVLDQAPAAPDVTGATTDTSVPAPDSAPLN
jgi:3D (Asp-Asp-Asp) domain-containing protein